MKVQGVAFGPHSTVLDRFACQCCAIHAVSAFNLPEKNTYLEILN